MSAAAAINWTGRSALDRLYNYRCSDGHKWFAPRALPDGAECGRPVTAGERTRPCQARVARIPGSRNPG